MRLCSIIAIAALATAGCSRSKLPELHPLEGQVLDDQGGAVSGGYLTFRTTIPNVVVTAAVGPDGKFEAFTTDTKTRGAKKQKGAPHATYEVFYMRPATDQAGAGEVAIREPLLVSPGMAPVVINLPGRKK